MTLGERISLLKNEGRLTTEALARLSGVPKGTINKILNGETKNPTARTLRQLAAALGCAPGELYAADSTPNMLREDIPAHGGMHSVHISVYGDYLSQGGSRFNIPDESAIDCDFVMTAEENLPTDCRITPGDFVFIKRGEAVDGSIAAVEIDGDAVLARIFLMDSGKAVLIERTGCTPMYFSGEDRKRLRIIGRAVGFQSRL